MADETSKLLSRFKRNKQKESTKKKTDVDFVIEADKVLTWFQ